MHAAQQEVLGRQLELDVLDAALAEATSGKGQIVLLAGEAGIGKTRLAREAAERARRAGLLVTWGFGTPGSPAFWPWIQVLRHSFEAEGGAEAVRQLGPAAAYVGQLVPEIRNAVPGLEQPPSLPPEPARFALFDAVATYLRKRSHGAPLAVVLEDLHWADRSSLLLLAFIAQQIGDARLLLLATYRETDLDGADLDAIGELLRHPWSRQITLRGLETADTARLTARTLGHTPAEDVAARIQQQTSGNPFFVIEVARLLAAAPGAEASPTSREIPDSVRVVIGQRLRRLSEPCQRALTLAAVLGQDFSLPLLGALCGLPSEPLADALDEACAAAVVSPSEQTVGAYRFTHELTRECLYQGVPPGRRAELHRQVGELLEARYGDDPEHAAEVAHHFFHAALGGDVRKALAHCRRAAEQSERTMAHEDAVRQYQRALQLLEQFEPSDRRARLELSLALGEAQGRAGESDQVRDENFFQAAAAARDLGDHEMLARAAWGLVQYKSGFEHSTPQLIALLEEALETMGPADSALRAMLLSKLSYALRRPGDHVRKETLSREAVAMARRTNDALALAHALSSEYDALLWRPEGVRLRLAAADESLQLGEKLHDLEIVVIARARRAWALLELGDVVAARSELHSVGQLAGILRHSYYLWWHCMFRACLALLEGRLDDAAQLSNEALGLHGQGQQETMLEAFRGQYFLLCWHQGRLAELEPLIRHGLELGSLGARPALAFCLAEQGRSAEARTQLELLAERHFVAIPHDLGWFNTMCVIAHTCAEVRVVDHAETLYKLLRPYNHLLVVAGGAVCMGSAALVLGRLAATLGRWEEGLQHFEDALQMNERIGARPQVAWGQYFHAAALLARGRASDREDARARLEVAAGLAKEIGLNGLLEKTTEAMSGFAPPDHSAPAGLDAALADGSDQPTEVGTDGRANPRTAMLQREGEYWTIAHRGTATRLKDQVGLRYLEHLLRRPGREFLASELIALCNPRAAGVHGDSPRPASDGGEALASRSDSDAGSLLDAQAMTAYRRRLEDLRETLDDAERCNDVERQRGARAEIEFLSEELARAVGLGGRHRPAGSQLERARVSTTRALKKTIGKIAAHDQALGHHLATAIKTGTFCSYDPGPEPRMRWQLHQSGS